MAVYCKERREGLDALYVEDGGAVWMRLVIAQVIIATDVKKAFAVDPPFHRYRFPTWDSEQALLPVCAAAKVALVQAICRQGRAWAESFVALAAGGKRKKLAYADVLLAVMQINDLAPAQDAYLSELWATACNQGIGLGHEPACDPGAQDARYQKPLAQLTVVQDTQGSWHVTGQDIVANSPAEFLQHQFMLKPMLHQLLAQPDSILRLVGGYAAGHAMDRLAGAVAALVASGVLDGTALTGDAIAALTRGDLVTAQRMQVRVLQAVAPAPAVIAPYAQTLCNLLASGHGGAAEAAQSLLAQLDSAQGLNGDLFQNACQVVFARKEKGLRRDQLAWAARRLKERPAEAAATVQGLIEALQVDDYAIQKDAVEKITKAWPQVGGAQQVALLALVDVSRGALDAKLHTQLMTALGAVQEPASTTAPANAEPAIAHVWTPPPRTPQALVPFARLVGIAEHSTPYLAALSAFNTTPSVNAIEQLLELVVRISNAGNAPLANKLLRYFRAPEPVRFS